MLEFLRKYNPIYWVVNNDSEEKEVYEILTEEEFCKQNDLFFSSENEESATSTPEETAKGDNNETPTCEETVSTSNSETPSPEKTVNVYENVVLDETEGVENIDRAILEKGLSRCVF